MREKGESREQMRPPMAVHWQFHLRFLCRRSLQPHGRSLLARRYVNILRRRSGPAFEGSICVHWRLSAVSACHCRGSARFTGVHGFPTTRRLTRRPVAHRPRRSFRQTVRQARGRCATTRRRFQRDQEVRHGSGRGARARSARIPPVAPAHFASTFRQRPQSSVPFLRSLDRSHHPLRLGIALRLAQGFGQRPNARHYKNRQWTRSSDLNKILKVLKTFRVSQCRRSSSSVSTIGARRAYRLDRRAANLPRQAHGPRGDAGPHADPAVDDGQRGDSHRALVLGAVSGAAPLDRVTWSHFRRRPSHEPPKKPG